MKKIILFALTIIAVSQTSCKDFLQEKPLSDITEENFYQSDADLSEAVIALYSNVQFMHQHNFYRFGDLAADAVAAGAAADALHKNIDALNINPSDATAAELKTYWKLCYKNINNSNLIIKKVPDAKNATAKAKQRALAEAYFYKGYAYYWLARMFKDVPLIETYPAPEKPFRSSQAEVLNAAVENLRLATGETNSDIILPTTVATAENGRPVLNSGLGLLSEVYLYKHDYTNAALYSKKIIDLNAYALWPVYYQTFLYANKYLSVPGTNKPEILFQINYHQDAEVLSRIVRDAAPAKTKIGKGVTRDGNEFYVARTAAVSRFQAGDKRKTDIFPATYPNTLDVQTAFPNNATQTFMYKYRMETQPSSATSGNIAQNITILRYADILLIYAEAINELNGPTTEAYAAINQVRARAGLSNLSGLSQAQFRDAIELERYSEFFFEGKRFWDLQRTGKFVEVMSTIIPGISADKQYFPIPQTELDANPNLLPQNPGW